MAADGLDSIAGKHDKEIGLLEELATQCARALRNLSVNRKYIEYFVSECLLVPIASNKTAILKLGTNRYLQQLVTYPNERISQQARRALKNLEVPSGK